MAFLVRVYLCCIRTRLNSVSPGFFRITSFQIYQFVRVGRFVATLRGGVDHRLRGTFLRQCLSDVVYNLVNL